MKTSKKKDPTFRVVPNFEKTASEPSSYQAVLSVLSTVMTYAVEATVEQKFQKIADILSVPTRSSEKISNPEAMVGYVLLDYILQAKPDDNFREKAKKAFFILIE